MVEVSGEKETTLGDTQHGMAAESKRPQQYRVRPTPKVSASGLTIPPHQVESSRDRWQAAEDAR